MTEETIFTEALERSTSTERKAFLDETCQGDTVLRQQVEALLDSHEQAGSFLGEPVPDRLASQLGSGSLDSTGQSLDFLAPSEKPGSLGRLGHYEIQEIIGSGGMGIVLRGVDERLHRVVAIKVLAAQLATNAAARQRFTREARAAAAVCHDHVVTVHGVEEAGGLPYLIMQYVGGISLQERISRSGPLKLHEVLRIGMQTAAGLAAAHAQGLVHRDIKPANILLENGVERVKITDFGLAHAVDDVRTTQPGTVVGTPEYMSPEQARGERVDHRSDLFSLGCVLYAMCAGRPPFRAESTVAVIKRVCEDTPRPLSEINPDIPAWLTDVIDKLIAKAPDERFQSASEIADLQEQFLAHTQQPSLIPRPASITPPRSARRQSGPAARRWSIAAAALLMVAATLVLGESTGITNVAAAVIRIARGDGILVVEIDDPNIQVLLDGDEIAITGAGPKELRLRPGQHQLQSVKDGQPVETKLVTITKGGRDVVKVTRQEARAPEMTTRLVWPDAPSSEGCPISPDGRLIAFCDENGNLALRELATGGIRTLTSDGTWKKKLPSGAAASYPCFTADGQLLYYWWLDYDQRRKEVRVIPTSGGQPRTIFRPGPHGANPWMASGWFPDNKSILAAIYGEDDTSIELAQVFVDDGAARKIATVATKGKYLGAQLSPDGKTIAACRTSRTNPPNKDLLLIDAATGKESLVPTHGPDSGPHAWTRDGKWLIYETGTPGASSDAGDVCIHRIVDGKPHGEPKIVRADWLELGVSQGITNDGSLYYGTWSGGPRSGNTHDGIHIVEFDLEKQTAAATPLDAERLSTRYDYHTPAWSPDGENLAYKIIGPNKDADIKIISFKGARPRAITPTWPKQPSYAMEWSPDGKSFLVSTDDEKAKRRGIYRIDSSSGELSPVIEAPDPAKELRGVFSGNWSLDGRGMYYVRNANVIMFRNVETGADSEILALDAMDSIYGITLSPDGNRLALVGLEKDPKALVLKLVDVTQKTSRDLVRSVWQTKGFGPNIAHWTPDGRTIVFKYRPAENEPVGLWFISADGGEPRKLDLTGIDASSITDIAVHPKQNRLALITAQPRNYQIWALENFLPPLGDPKPSPGAGVSAVKSK